jgi:phosphatidylinositol-3-phosphatase
MSLKQTAAALVLTAAAGPALAGPRVPHLDHVFVIVMENHHYSQILGNPNMPFLNGTSGKPGYASTANLAQNYFAVGHPSLTNYLEIVGGSNFGVVNDNSPDWHNERCQSTLAVPVLEGGPSICPIAGFGLDAATPAVDTTNEGTVSEPIYNAPFAPAATVGRTIADQLDEEGLTWKSYQENLPPYGADNVNNSDGLLSDSRGAVFAAGMPKLYAVKHNPFVYFESVQEHGLRNIVSFPQLYADLRAGNVPNLSFVVPNQCHDQHGRGSSEMGTGCSVDENSIAQGDAALQDLVAAIHSSPVWGRGGRNVIVVLWDENDYSSLPNQVVALVDTNYGVKGIKSNVSYNHFSLLKTLEAGFGLGYLNHAADSNVVLMVDLFGER